MNTTNPLENKDKTTYLTNKDNYYFELVGDFDISKFVGCKIHNSLQEMYKYVCNISELEPEEVEGYEIYINITTEMECLNSIQIVPMNNEDVADVYGYINEFQM